jgi:DNA polymerase III alpha subunit/nucleotidyltransferase/DNA polymerase involved in DNA repair
VFFDRSIVHLDADAFFASVEQAADTRLRGKPIAVGGEKRGIIASASYEARKFGIYTPMPTVAARRLCPKLILLPGDFEKYELFSRLMFSYAYDFTPDVEIGSIDEGYFDLTGVRKPAVGIAETIRHAIRQALKLSVSEGIAANKLVSQIASKLKKPAAFQFVPPGNEADFLSSLANKWLPGVGPKLGSQFNAAGLARIGQIACTPVELLGMLAGGLAPQLKNFARGIDERPVVPARVPAKSYGEQETFAADTTDEEFLQATLRRMADKLMAKVRDDGKSIRTLTVKVRYNDMDEEQASESLAEPTDLETDTYAKTSTLLHKAWKRRVSLRLVSLKLSNVYEGRLWSGLALDVSARQHDAQQRLSDVVDALRQKFGRGVVLRGHDFVLRARETRVGSRRRQSAPISETERSAPTNVGGYTTMAQPRREISGPDDPKGNTVAVKIISNAGAERERTPRGNDRRRGIVVERTGGPYLVDGGALISPPHGTPPLKEPPVPYPLAVVERQRLGKYAARQPPATKARPFSSPSPELRFRAEFDAQNSKFEVQGSRFSLHRPSSTIHAPVPLNVHSYYSFLDSTLSPQAIVDFAVRHDLPAIALTDKNNLHGAVEFAQAAAAAGIKPIIGAELDWNGHRVCLYVENQTGYHNLCRILSAEGRRARGEDRVKAGHRASPDCWGSYPATRSQFGIRNSEFGIPSGFGLRNSDFPLFSHTDGLLAVSADPALASFFPGRFYFAANNPDAFERPLHHPTIPPFHHSTTPIHQSSNPVFQYSNFPSVASFPIHYELPSDRWKYDIIQSIRTLTLLRQAHPEKRLDGDYHFRPAAEMQKLFATHPELLAHSREIAERCSFAFSLGKPQFPGYPPRDGSPPAAFLRRLVMEGLQRRYPKEHARLKPQLEQELAIITEVGYEEYFLVMWDILQECRRRGIEWITRGSAADSLACYCLEISGVCPIRFDLYFRRFLNKDRMALNKLPDIDVDFPHDRKDDVVDLIFERYGPKNAAVVGGFSTFQSRSAFAEIAKVLGVSEFQVRRLTERLPHFSRATDLVEAVAIMQECHDLPFQEEPYRTALQLAAFLDGFPRYPKMHPCGLVLSRQDMDEITPCFISAKGYPTTHFDMDSVEAVGLVKMDILAQGGLAVMRDVQEMIALNPKSEGRNPKEIRSSNTEIRKPGFEVQTVSSSNCAPSDFGFPSPMGPFDHPEVWQLISSGNARAVHHIESPAMLSLSKMCNVHDIDTLIAIVSVIRPGAANESKKMEFARRYQGLSPVRYPHPSLERCLHSTYGLVVYEEHILQICEAFAGLPPGRADVLRRALGKNKLELIDQIQIEFTDCARKLGRSESEIAEVWDLVSGFRGYAFCKAHSTAYGVEAYQSAWLKCHYPAEVMAAVLTNGKGFYSPLVYVLECHRLGIPLLPPSVNEPGPAFTVTRDEGRGARDGNPNSEFRVPKEARIPKSEAAGSVQGAAAPVSPFDPRPSTPLQTSSFDLRNSFGFRPSDFGLPLSFIRVPLLNVKGLTLRTKESILRERSCGAFSSLTDFALRVQPLPEEMESLIRVGAFDDFGKPRTAQYWEFKGNAECGMRSAECPDKTPHSALRTPHSHSPTRPLKQPWLLSPADLTHLPSVPLSEPTRLERLRAEEELLGYPVSGHPLELFPDIAWDTYCPISRLGQHLGEQIVTCGLVIEQRLFHQVTGEPMKFITIADRTGIVETELFAKTYKSYGLNTVRYRVLEITATVEPFENGRGHTLRVLRAGKPRTRK